MRAFVIRRLMYMILSVFAATVIVFGLSRMVGDPRLLYAKPGGYGITPEQFEAIGDKLGLDRPLVVQYGMWLGKILRGDLGRTLVNERPVTKAIGEKIGNTAQLAVVAWILATLIGVPLGVLSAVSRGSPMDYMGRGFALFGQALPGFWIGIIFILVFAARLGWLPSGTRGFHEGFPLAWGNVKFFVLPAITLALGAAAGYLRITRSAMLEVMDSEYVKLARAKGVSQGADIWKHAFKNALIPPLTVSSLLMASLLTGAIVVETVFSWPGLGNLAIQAVDNNDFPVLTATVLIFAVVWAVVNFLTDIAYALIDPRIRYS